MASWRLLVLVSLVVLVLVTSGTPSPAVSNHTANPQTTLSSQAPSFSSNVTSVPSLTTGVQPEGPHPTYDDDGEAVTIHTTRQYDLGSLRIAVQTLVGADAEIVIVSGPSPLRGTGGEMAITFRFIGASAIVKSSAFLALSTAALETQGITSAAPATIVPQNTGLSVGAIVGIAVGVLLVVTIAVVVLVTRKPSEGGSGGAEDGDNDYTNSLVEEAN